MNRAAKSKSVPSKTRTNFYPFWSPRFWHGMQIGDYLKLLASNRFRVDLSRWPMAGGVAFCSAVNWSLGVLQKLTCGRRVANTKIEQPPLFVIGHWRSGTTLLHELLALDERFSYPSTYDCFCPHHFLLTRPYFSWLVSAVLPKHRPMDKMVNGVDLPQEDEFALCTLGAPTPYFRVAFPNGPVVHEEFFDMENVAQDKLDRFHDALTYFLRALTYRDKKRLILKSPPHTGRIGRLTSWFPGAKFVHISRNPYEVFASTIRLWKSLDTVQGFQKPRYDDAALHDLIFKGYDLMYGGYFRHSRNLIDNQQLLEIRYEDLVAQPRQTVEKIYQTLELGDFESIAPKIEQYFAKRKDYRANQNPVDDSLKAEIKKRWHQYIDQYGYGDCDVAPQQDSAENTSSVA